MNQAAPHRSAYQDWLAHQPRPVQQMVEWLVSNRILVATLIVAIILTGIFLGGRNHWAARQQKEAAALYAEVPFEGPERAVKLAEVAEQYPTSGAGILARFQLGKQAFEAKDYDKAVQWFEPLTQLGQAKAMIRILSWHNLGAIREAQQDWTGALNAYQQAAADAENKAVALAYYSLGRVSVKLEQFDKAREWFQKAAEAGLGQSVAERANERLLWLNINEKSVAASAQ